MILGYSLCILFYTMSCTCTSISLLQTWWLMQAYTSDSWLPSTELQRGTRLLYLIQTEQIRPPPVARSVTLEKPNNQCFIQDFLLGGGGEQCVSASPPPPLNLICQFRCNTRHFQSSQPNKSLFNLNLNLGICIFSTPPPSLNETLIIIVIVYHTSCS